MHVGGKHERNISRLKGSVRLRSWTLIGASPSELAREDPLSETLNVRALCLHLHNDAGKIL